MTSTIQGELVEIAKEAGVIYQPTTWTPEPIEGSDTLGMMTINAGCQGTYAALAKFVNLVDKSPRFLIIESMVAAPQQTGQILNVTIKMDTFVKEQGIGFDGTGSRRARCGSRRRAVRNGASREPDNEARHRG